MKRDLGTMGLLLLSLCSAAALWGCGQSPREAELESKLAAAAEENDKLRQELETAQKRMEQLVAANAALAPKVTQLENEIEAARRSLSRIAALTPDGMNDRMRAEIRRLVQEVLEADQEERAAQQREWIEDLRSRHLDELVAAAHLSPEQKEKLKVYEEEEREAIRAAYMSARMGGTPATALNKARDDARIEKEKKIKALLDPEQYSKYQEWKRQGVDPFRAGINRRQQAPNANQKDM
jgi:predicted RNase H-like nuclease (RuvC/YqgF family)